MVVLLDADIGNADEISMHFDRDNQRFYMVIDSHLQSRGYKEITFDMKDFQRIASWEPQRIKEWANGILCGFEPNHAARSV